MRIASVLVLCLLPSLAGAQAPSVQILHEFTPSAARPNGGLVQVPDGSLYGVTESGIIRLSIGGEVTQVARFHDGLGTGALVRASDGALYGTTYDGGPSNRGTVFRFDPVTGALRTLHGFASPTEGRNPLGGLVQVGGSLYGVTRYGPGRFAIGTIFHVVVATGAVVTDAAFSLASGVPASESTYYPSGPLTLGPDGRLYGTTAGGSGALYAFDPVSRGITRVRSFSFTGINEPKALTLGADGSLYGNASAGGSQGAGAVYRYTPATDQFEIVYPLVPANGFGGRSPGPLLAASDGHFYGVTNRHNDFSEGGTVFRLRAGAGGTFTGDTLRVLDRLVDGAPSDTVLTQGADGLIYGYAANGGPTGSGTLFRFDPLAGGPPANPIAFTLVHTFPHSTTWGPSAPVAGPDGFLYGTTSFGGATNRGAVYRLAPATGAVTILGPVPGNGIATSALNSGLVPGPDGLLYGLATEFAPDRSAVTSIIRVDPASGLVTVAVGGAGPPLSWPFGPSEERNPGLVRTAAGQLLGVRYDPSTYTVRVFRFDPAADTVADVAVRPALGVQSNLVPMAGGGVVALGTFAESGALGLEWRSAVTRLNPAVAPGYQEVRMTPDMFSFGTVVEGADGFLYVRSQTLDAFEMRRVNPVTGAVSTACSVGADHPSVAADGALYGFESTAVGPRLLRCDPVTGAVTQAALPAAIGRVLAPMARVGNLLYGASLDGGRGRPGGSLFQVAAAGATLPQLDTDGDTLPNRSETAYGLDPFDASRGSGAADDPDGDGRTNAQELAEGTHPRGFVTRLFAEGASNAFFRTRFDLANPTLDQAIIRARFLTDTGATVAADLLVPPLGHRGLDPSTLAGLPPGSFSVIFESDVPIAVDRSMSWDASGYGSHLETGIAAPATTWYFAEGATSGDFSLFYLLQNPQPTAVTATVRYLRPSGQPPIDKTYNLPPNSRTTLAVDGERPELASTDVSAVITASLPIVAERAMYVNRPGQPFAAGHESAGVTAPAIDWFFAEGATGAFFDLFVLIANPSTTAATVAVDYLRSSGPPLTKTYVVPALSRITIWVDDEQLPAGSGQKPLAQGSVSAAVHVTNGVPVIAERAMWWPGPETTSNFWYEAHNSPGATGVATRWLIGGGEVAGADGADTYILIANTADRAGQATLHFMGDDGDSSFGLGSLIDLAPKSRTTVNLRSYLPGVTAAQSLGVLVQSDGPDPVPIVVERATYGSPGGVFWGRGGNALATPLP